MLNSLRGSACSGWHMCVTTETRHLNRLGQLGECGQESNTDSHGARNKAQAAQQSTAVPLAGEKAPQSKGQSTRQPNPPMTRPKQRPDKAAGLHTSQTLPNLTRGSGARATPLAPRLAYVSAADKADCAHKLRKERHTPTRGPTSTASPQPMSSALARALQHICRGPLCQLQPATYPRPALSLIHI